VGRRPSHVGDLQSEVVGCGSQRKYNIGQIISQLTVEDFSLVTSAGTVGGVGGSV